MAPRDTSSEATRALRADASSMLLHPVALVAIVVLAINDHYLKANFSGVLTGKISDVAGLIFFPGFLQMLWGYIGRLVRAQASPSRVLLIASVATALVFAAIQLVPLASDVYRYGLAALQWPVFALVSTLRGEALPGLGLVHLVPDPSDLIALPAAFTLYALQARRARV